MAYHTYILELEDGNFYVGSTYNIGRVRQHVTKDKDIRNKDVAYPYQPPAWTVLHKPIRIVEVVTGSRSIEKAKTLEYMKRYGWEKVRGYAWTKREMSRPPKDLEIITL